MSISPDKTFIWNFSNSSTLAEWHQWNLKSYITENTRRDNLFYSTLKTRMHFFRIFWHVGRSSEEIWTQDELSWNWCQPGSPWHLPRTRRYCSSPRAHARSRQAGTNLVSCAFPCFRSPQDLSDGGFVLLIIAAFCRRLHIYWVTRQLVSGFRTSPSQVRLSLAISSGTLSFSRVVSGKSTDTTQGKCAEGRNDSFLEGFNLRSTEKPNMN